MTGQILTIAIMKGCGLWQGVCIADSLRENRTLALISSKRWPQTLFYMPICWMHECRAPAFQPWAVNVLGKLIAYKICYLDALGNEKSLSASLGRIYTTMGIRYTLPFHKCMRFFCGSCSLRVSTRNRYSSCHLRVLEHWRFCTSTFCLVGFGH